MMVLREGLENSMANIIVAKLIKKPQMTDWIKRWEKGETGWHQASVNTKLVDFLDCLEQDSNPCVFVPLCGKSLDMLYLLEQGFHVVGVELSKLAVEAFFAENNISYSVIKQGNFQRYCAHKIDIYCGDFFDLEASHLQAVNGVYDRASLIALPIDLRAKYVKHLYSIITSDCKILLLTLNYPQAQMSGPPYALDQAEVKTLFTKRFDCEQLQCFNDIQNEPKFQRAGVDYVEKATYCLRKK